MDGKTFKIVFKWLMILFLNKSLLRFRCTQSESTNIKQMLTLQRIRKKSSWSLDSSKIQITFFSDLDNQHQITVHQTGCYSCWWLRMYSKPTRIEVAERTSILVDRHRQPLEAEFHQLYPVENWHFDLLSNSLVILNFHRTFPTHYS